jgi:hypothetical protein
MERKKRLGAQTKHVLGPAINLSFAPRLHGDIIPSSCRNLFPEQPLHDEPHLNHPATSSETSDPAAAMEVLTRAHTFLLARSVSGG